MEVEDLNNDWFSGIEFGDHEAEIQDVAQKASEETASQVKAEAQSKLQSMEKMIVPFLIMIRDKGGDSEVLTIKWPNRREQINKQIDRIQDLVSGIN